MIMRLVQIACLLAAMISGITAYAGETEKTVIDGWYRALSSVDRAALGGLLADDARITLGDLDIEQNKTEFIASLDEWEDAMRGSTLRHAIQSDSAGLVTVLVCYTFASNETLTREVFGFAGALIRTSEQETVSDSCAGFPD
jgi:hypothetical protein